MDQGFQYDEEAEAKAEIEAVKGSMDETSRRRLSDVEVRMDDLPEWMFAEASTRDLKRFRLTINRVRYREADEGSALAPRPRAGPPHPRPHGEGRLILLGGDPQRR